MRKKILAFFLIFLLPWVSHSKIREFETTRMKGTAGAGVGSILMDEASILNPAPIGFFNMGSIYVQKTGAEFSSTSEANLTKIPESDTLAAIVSDAKGSMKGSISYYKQTEKFAKRKRLSVSMATPVGKRSSFGVTYRDTKDTLNYHKESIATENNYKQVVLGISHAVSDYFTFGIVVIDPFKERPEDNLGLLGAQYVYQDYISIMFDFGADYNNPLDETFLFRSALQLKLFDDFYLRTGLYQDQGKKEKGTGVGIGWVQPRLNIDLALKNSTLEEDLSNLENIQLGERIKETSFSLSYRF